MDQKGTPCRVPYNATAVHTHVVDMYLQQPRELAISVRYVRVPPRRQRLDHVSQSGQALVDLSTFLREGNVLDAPPGGKEAKEQCIGGG